MKPRDFLEMGVAVIPVLPKSKRPAVPWLGYQTQLPSQAQLAHWERPALRYNLAVVTGWQGLVVLDFDTFVAHDEWLLWALHQGGVALYVAARTYKVRTARGVHAYVFVKSDVPRSGKLTYTDKATGEIRHWGEIKGKGGYVLIPPSVHPSGTIYQAWGDSAPILTVESLEDVLPDPPSYSAQPVPAVHVYPGSSLYPATIIEQIKDSFRILDFFPDATLSGKSRWYVAHCPWHDDRHESLWIDADRGICGCYAGCTANGKGNCLNVIGVYAKLHGTDNRGAVREMAKLLRA